MWSRSQWGDFTAEVKAAIPAFTSLKPRPKPAAWPMQTYRYTVSKGEMRFNILIQAGCDEHAARQAAEIGKTLGIMLIGPP